MNINDAELYRLIGERIKQRRVEIGMTQNTLADAVGQLRTSITNIEAGRQKAPLHVLYKLCSVLGMELVTILPSTAELARSNTIPVNVGGEVIGLPAQTAEVVQQLLVETGVH